MKVSYGLWNVLKRWCGIVRNLFKGLPTFAADYSGICNAVDRMGCLAILHGQGGCIGGVNTCDNFEMNQSEMKLLFSKISEVDTVIGNDEKMFTQIEKAVEEIPCDFLVICGSPIPMLIGVDWKAWVRTLEERTGKTVIALNSKGFQTYDEGEKALFLSLIQTFSRRIEIQDRVNVIGDTCLNGWSEEMRMDFEKQLKKEFDQVVFWNMNATKKELETMACAKLNIAVSASAIPAVKKLEQLYGTPYKIGFEVGGNRTENEIKENKQWYHNSNVLLVGEQVSMNSLRASLLHDFGIKSATVASFFNMDTELMTENDVRMSGEDDYEMLLKKRDSFDYIIGDELLERYGGYRKGFLCYSHIALSSILLSHSIPNIIGDKGYLFLKRGLEKYR